VYAVLQIFVALAAAGVALLAAYLLMLTIAAFIAMQRTPARGSDPTHRFLFLIPAHNEETLLPSTIASLQSINYPRDLYAVHVVADNCTDQTATVGRNAGATVHERTNLELRGKGHALEWLLTQIWEQQVPHDAIIILDADTVISPNFLTVMDARMARGERAIQAYYAVRDPAASWGASLRMIALAAIHYLRPLGRSVLGGSTGLKGNGMVFAADIPQTYRWSNSLTEDIEYHMHLITAGQRVTFAPDAVVYAEMPTNLKAATSQNERWERGRVQMLTNYVPQLLKTGLSKGRFMLIDAAIEQIIPPFSILVIVTALVLGAALLVGYPLAIGLAIFAVVAQVIYVLSGLWLARVPARVWQALLYAPVFVAWKIWVYLGVLFRRNRNAWVRTTRNDAS
jgi:cellulose synthase/poly-beta-1,6-N-acetylglucosamine synthase-like glycosyltransferase